MYYFDRLRVKFNCIERCSDTISNDLHGNYDYNKNIFLLIPVFMLPLILINNIFILPIAVFIGVGYIVPQVLVFAFSLKEYIMEEPKDRTYIKQKIEK